MHCLYQQTTIFHFQAKVNQKRHLKIDEIMNLNACSRNHFASTPPSCFLSDLNTAPARRRTLASVTSPAVVTGIFRDELPPSAGNSNEPFNFLVGNRSPKAHSRPCFIPYEATLMASLSVNLERGTKTHPTKRTFFRSGSTDPGNFVMRRMWPNSRVIAPRTKKGVQKRHS